MAGVAVFAMTGACTDRQQAGAPTAADGVATSTSGTAATSTSASTSAARPAELPLADVQPCELVTDAMRGQFGIDRPDAPSATNPNAPVCTFLSTTVGGYVVSTVRDAGVAALGRPAGTTVGGFPAVEIRRPDISTVCHLGIDVADGQRLDIEIQRTDRTRTPDEICQDTMRFAEAVLTALRQRLGR